jgi:hypothetical protein
MISTLIGSLLGLFTRALPEVIGYFDKKNDRKHELEMAQEQTKYSLALGAQKQEEIKIQGVVDYDNAALDALKTAITVQGEKTGSTFIDGLNALIRPFITVQWVIILYPAVIITKLVALLMNSVPILTALPLVWGDFENALVAGIVNFFFLNRVLKIK